MLRSEVLSTTNFLARLPASDEARFLRPLRPRQDVNIWYAHHQSYADADPLSAIFDLLGTVHTDTSMPRLTEEIEQYDAFVISSPVPESGPLTAAEIHALTGSTSYRNQPIYLFAGMHGAAPVADLHCRALPTTIHHIAECVDQALTAKGQTPAPNLEK